VDGVVVFGVVGVDCGGGDGGVGYGGDDEVMVVSRWCLAGGLAGVGWPEYGRN
ncbi:hypothetical protein Tco_1542421, partial [Tanacetum coccineum]